MAEPTTPTGPVADPATGATGSSRVDTRNVAEDGSGASLGELLGQSMQEVSQLFRDEVELAKAELRVEAQKAKTEIGKAQEEAKKAGEAAGKLGAAGVLGHLALLLLTFAAAWGLAELMPAGFAFLIVAVVVAAIAGVLAAAGRKQMKRVSFSNIDFRRIDPKPDQAIEELKETKQWAKQQ